LDEIEGACIINGKNQTVVEKLERDRQIRRPRCRWKDNIKMNIRVTGFKCVDWIHMAHDSGWW
jgi:hypothetical protein